MERKKKKEKMSVRSLDFSTEQMKQAGKKPKMRNLNEINPTEVGLSYHFVALESVMFLCCTSQNISCFTDVFVLGLVRSTERKYVVLLYH